MAPRRFPPPRSVEDTNSKAAEGVNRDGFALVRQDARIAHPEAARQASKSSSGLWRINDPIMVFYGSRLPDVATKPPSA